MVNFHRRVRKIRLQKTIIHGDICVTDTLHAQGQQISEDLADKIMSIFDLSILDQLAAHAKEDISFTVCRYPGMYVRVS